MDPSISKRKRQENSSNTLKKVRIGPTVISETPSDILYNHQHLLDSVSDNEQEDLECIL